RGRELTAMFADPDVDVVHPLTGGYGASQVVPFLDFDTIAANPKPFIGYSDTTALHVAIRRRANLLALYGPGFLDIGIPQRAGWSKDRLIAALGSNDPIGEIPGRPDDPYVGAIGSGSATAPLVGGCLWLLRETLATPWELELAGTILFFED